MGEVVQRLNRSRYAARLYVAGCGLTAAAFYLLDSEIWKTAAYAALIGGTVVAADAGRKLHAALEDRHWSLFFRAMFFFFGGSLVSIWEASAGLDPTREVGLSDILTITGYVFMFAALVVLARARSPQGDMADLIDALIIAGGVGLALWVVWVGPLFSVSSLSTSERISALALPVFNLTILTLLLRLTFTPGPRSRAYHLFVGAVVASLVASQWNLVALQDGTYGPGHALEIPRMLAYVLAGLAVLHPSMAELGRPVPGAQPMLTQPRLLMFGAGWLAGPLAYVLSLGSNNPVRAADVVIGSSFIFFLMIVRMWTLLRGIRRREEHFRSLVQNSADGIVVVGRDRKLAYVSDATTSILGYSPEELLDSSNTFDFVEPSDRALAAERYERALAAPGSKECLEMRATRKDGSVRWLEVDMVNLLHDSSVEGVVINFRDVTERRQGEERFRSLVQHSSDAIAVVDPGLHVTYASPSLERLLRVQGPELMGRPLTDWFDAGECARLEALALLRPDVTEVLTCSLMRPGGEEVSLEIVATNMLDNDSVGGIVLNLRDVSERVVLEKQLRHQAFHDPLTGLANRALFLDRLTHALQRGSRAEESCYVIFLDIDNFKRVNDGQGHNVGDHCLQMTAGRLLGCSRVSDTVARMGGDEFAILLEGSTVEGAEVLAERILEKMTEPLHLPSGDVVLTPSIGIAPAAGDEDAKGVLRNADVAMYLAKRGPDRRYEVFERAMYAETVRRIEVESELRRAIAEQEFDIHVQPVVDVTTKLPLGGEALVRWQHPDKGMVYPGDFIDVAEETGLIVDIGVSVLEQACETLAGWGRDPSTAPLTMWVNISARQLGDPELIGWVKSALAHSGAEPGQLVLEITESAMAEAVEDTIARLAELKAIGVQLAIDDFGTGYSSLSYLQNFPVDILKIDRSFTAQLDLDTRDAPLAHAIIGIGRSLGLTTVAEGVETEGQSAALLQLGCRRAQGFLYAKPMPATDFTTYVRETLAAQETSSVPG